MSSIIPGWPVPMGGASAEETWPGILTAGKFGVEIGFMIGVTGSLEGTVLKGASVAGLASAEIVPGIVIFGLSLIGDYADAFNTGEYRDHKLYVDSVEIGRIPEGWLINADATYYPDHNVTLVSYLSQSGFAFVEGQTYEVKLDY